MALPPLPENNTSRLFITYTTGSAANAQEHTMSIRFEEATVNPVDIMLDLADALGAGTNETELFEGWRVLSAEVQAEGSQVRLPTTVPGALLAILGAGQSVITPAEQAREIRFIGRGIVTGRRVSLSLYGVNNQSIEENDFRFTPGGGTLLGSLRTLFALTGQASIAYTNIGHGPTAWYNYVNWQYNSHWENEQRV